MKMKGVVCSQNEILLFRRELFVKMRLCVGQKRVVVGKEVAREELLSEWSRSEVQCILFSRKISRKIICIVEDLAESSLLHRFTR